MWKLRKAPKRELYWVVNKETGKKYSKEPLPKETATAQMRVLYRSEGMEGGMFAKPRNTIAKSKNPTTITTKHSVLTELAKHPITIPEREEHRIKLVALKHIVETQNKAGALPIKLGHSLTKKISKAIDERSVSISEKYKGKGRGGVTIPKNDFVKEHVNLLGILKRGNKSELNKEANDQAKELQKVILRGGFMGNPYYQQIAEAAYSNNPPHQIGHFRLILNTPTLKFYNNDAIFAVGIRGTNLNDKNDIHADTMALVGNVKQSQRYHHDLAEMKQMKHKYPQYQFIGVAHSLGGAIMDGLLRDGLLQSGVSYNALVEPHELKGNPLHHRIYHSDDPIYKIIGKTIPNVEVVYGNQGFWNSLLKFALPFGLSTLFSAYIGHALKIFR